MSFEFAASTQTPRVLLFSHDTYGLGHLRRSTAIAHAIARRVDDASILYVTGAPLPSCFEMPARCDVVKLPILTKDDFGRYAPARLDVTVDLALSLRRGIITEAVRRFDPHVVLVDHQPLGAGGELRDALTWLKSHRPGTRVILGLRDVIDEPERVRQEFGSETLPGIIRSYYDDVLVYGDPRVFDPVTAYEFPADVAARAQHVGYVCTRPDEGARPVRGPRTRPRVAVVTGGGCDGERLHDVALDALSGDLSGLDADFELTFGPFLDAAAAARLTLRAAADPRVDAAAFRGDLGSSLRGADLVIAMAGANTVAEILDADVPAILAPRTRPRKEQLLRAERLESLGLARVLDLEAGDAAARLSRLVRAAFAGELLPRVRLRPRCDGDRGAAEHVAAALACATRVSHALAHGSVRHA